MTREGVGVRTENRVFQIIISQLSALSIHLGDAKCSYVQEHINLLFKQIH